MAAGIVPTAVLFDEDRFDETHAIVSATQSVTERYLVPAELIAGASTLAAQPRVIAIFPQPVQASFASLDLAATRGVFLAGVADPGNVGTIIRSAAALGSQWVALGPGSSDPYHPRATRAAMGATFALPLLTGVSAEDLATRDGLRIVAAVASGGVPPWNVDLSTPHVLALGAERHGLEPSFDVLEVKFPVTRITIPQVAGAESLNVSAAAAALLAESARQVGGAR